MFSALKIGLMGTGQNFIVTEAYYKIPTLNYEYWGHEAYLGIGGSVAPTTLLGQTIDRLVYFEVAFMKFRIALIGNHPQNLFHSITPQDGDTYYTSAADDYSYNGGLNTTLWDWGSGGTPATRPARWDGSGTSTVTIII